MKIRTVTINKFQEFETVKSEKGLAFEAWLYDTIDLLIYFLSIKASPKIDKPTCYDCIEDLAINNYNLSRQAMNYRAQTSTPYIYLSWGKYNKDKLHMLLLKTIKSDLLHKN